jgi:hypothetical protein
MTVTYEKIASTTLSSTVATVTFSSISGAYTDLVLILNPIANTATDSYPYMRFNSDTGSNYSRTFMRGTATTASSDRGTNETLAYLIGGNVVQTNSAFNGIVHINNYSNTTTYKNWLTRTNSATGTNASVEHLIGLWRNTSAITSIAITCGNNSFVSGSTFALYGIKAE